MHDSDLSRMFASDSMYIFYIKQYQGLFNYLKFVNVPSGETESYERGSIYRLMEHKANII